MGTESNAESSLAKKLLFVTVQGVDCNSGVARSDIFPSAYHFMIQPVNRNNRLKKMKPCL